MAASEPKPMAHSLVRALYVGGALGYAISVAIDRRTELSKAFNGLKGLIVRLKKRSESEPVPAIGDNAPVPAFQTFSEVYGSKGGANVP